MQKPIRFRSPTDKPIRVASTTSHIAVVGPQWRELPEGLHALAVQCGCVSDYIPAESMQADDAQGREEGPDARIRDVLRAMKRNPENGDFAISTGLPNLNNLSKKLGFGVVRSDVLRIWQEVQGEAESRDDNAQAAA